MTFEEAIKILNTFKDLNNQTQPSIVLDAVDTAVNALESQRWIPVTERLPEELDQTDSRWSRYSRPSEDVLTVVSGRCNVLWFSYSDKLWCSVEEDITYWKDEVTHWMHLPKPPKEVEDDK